MSGKGKSSSGSNNSGQSGNSSSGTSEPQVVSGCQYHMYSQGSGGDRYAYIGKDESGEPEFIDYGPKGGRR